MEKDNKTLKSSVLSLNNYNSTYVKMIYKQSKQWNSALIMKQILFLFWIDLNRTILVKEGQYEKDTEYNPFEHRDMKHANT